jgi:hypothetical protein
MARVMQFRSENDIKNKWYAMQRKGTRDDLKLASTKGACTATKVSVDSISSPRTGVACPKERLRITSGSSYEPSMMERVNCATTEMDPDTSKEVPDV